MNAAVDRKCFLSLEGLQKMLGTRDSFEVIKGGKGSWMGSPKIKLQALKNMTLSGFYPQRICWLRALH